MGDYYILDADNRPVPVKVMEWAHWFEKSDRRIGYTEITSEVRVSTVFLGIDHRFSGNGPPLLFETMIFGGPLADSQWRYVSHDDALAGHAVAVRKARAAAGQRIKSGA